MSLRKKGRQQLRQKISVHWTRKKLRNTPLFASLAHFLSNWPRLPSPFNLPPPPPQDPSPSARWFVVTGELCLCRLHLYLSLSLKAPPTYLPNTLTTTTADETLTSAATEDQVRQQPSFLFEGDLVTHRPLSLYRVYISLPMLLFFSPNQTITRSAGLSSHLGHNVDGGNKGST
jgi:hypothetical protein